MGLGRDCGLAAGKCEAEKFPLAWPAALWDKPEQAFCREGKLGQELPKALTYRVSHKIKKKE